jgi:hypothetical protein
VAALFQRLRPIERPQQDNAARSDGASSPADSTLERKIASISGLKIILGLFDFSLDAIQADRYLYKGIAHFTKGNEK